MAGIHNLGDRFRHRTAEQAWPRLDYGRRRTRLHDGRGQLQPNKAATDNSDMGAGPDVLGDARGVAIRTEGEA